MKRPRTLKKLAYYFRPHLGVKNNIKYIASIPTYLNPEKFVASNYSKMTSSDFLYSGDNTIEDMGKKWAKANGLKKVAEDQSQWFSKKMINPLFKIEYRYLLLKWRYLSGCKYNKSF